jgi:putative Mn2+ efflux pump MntP
MPRLILFVLPLGLDTFAVAAALGIRGLPARERLRVSLLMSAFEMGMPVIGLLVGDAAGRAIGHRADYVAMAVLALLGAWMLLHEDDDESEAVGALAAGHGLAALALGLSISLDELAIGFSLAVLRLPLGILCLVIAVQAAAATQLGLRLGRRVGEEMRENAERAAGVALIALAIVLLVLH